MLCLSLSTSGQSLGANAPSAGAFTPLPTITVPYALVSQPTQCAPGQYVLVTHTEWTAVTSVTSPEYDYALGSAFWAFGFTGVMILYFSSHAIGLVLNAVRRF